MAGAIRRNRIQKEIMDELNDRVIACQFLIVRPKGANHLWRVPPGALSIEPVADERLGRVTGGAGAS
ncbi:MAG TPA: hypothetical protein VK281_00725 [Xanthobacteraceae bacterium]|nr:hypothetical protein [Xanthobacteraceae bacterium]